MERRRVLLGLISVLTLVGCADAPANLQGQWMGTWSLGSYTDSAQATLTQSGSSVSGTVQFGGLACVTAGSLTGTVMSNHIDGIVTSVSSSSDTLSFSADLSGTTLSGTFTGTSGFCAGASGSLQFHRTS